MLKKLVIGSLLIGALSGCSVIEPGTRGVKVSLGTIDETPLQPGVNGIIPLVTDVTHISIQQSTSEITADCFSSDLQQVKLKLKVLYRVPEESVIELFKSYKGSAFDTLIAPRVQEATKEVTSTKTAADIVKEREAVKVASLAGSKKKIGKFLEVVDIVIEEVTLSKDLENAIEAKMVQQQDAEKAVFRLQQVETDAKTEIAKARGQAESIRIQGEALQKNPSLVQLKLVEKWNGVAPVVMGSGTNMLMPMPTSSSPVTESAAPAKHDYPGQTQAKQ